MEQMYSFDISIPSESDINYIKTLIDMSNGESKILSGVLAYPDLFITVYEYLLSKGYDMAIEDVIDDFVRINTTTAFSHRWLRNAMKTFEKLEFNNMVTINKLIFTVLRNLILKLPSDDDIMDMINTIKEYISPDDLIIMLRNIINDNRDKLSVKIQFLEDIINKL